MIQKEGVDKADLAKSWLKLALEHGARRKAIFSIAGVIVAKFFFPELDQNLFLYFREQDIRLVGNCQTIIENLDSIQFLMPFEDPSDSPVKEGLLTM